MVDTDEEYTGRKVCVVISENDIKWSSCPSLRIKLKLFTLIIPLFIKSDFDVKRL